MPKPVASVCYHARRRVIGFSSLALVAFATVGTDLAVAVERLREARPEGVPDASIAGIEYHVALADRWRVEDRVYAAYLRRVASEMVVEALDGRDPYPTRRGTVHRAMRSSFAPGGLRPYGLFVPPSYDPARRWPLLVVLHGAASDHMTTIKYALGRTIRNDRELKALVGRRFLPPSSLPDLPALVATPSGYWNTEWRWAGETEILEIVDDLVEHYAVDPDRVWLSGMSRGAWGAVRVGLRHAGRFAAIVDMCGFADNFVGRPGSERNWDRPVRQYERALLRLSRPVEILENARGTQLVFLLGGRDPGVSLFGPRRVARRFAEIGGRARFIEYPGGFHPMWVPAFRGGYLYRLLENVRRERRPTEIGIYADGYRTAEQRWARVEQIERHGLPARLSVRAAEGLVNVETDNVDRFSLALRSDESPDLGASVLVVVDGTPAYSGPPPVGRLHLARHGETWSPWDGRVPEPGTRKVRGVSGPIHDAFFDRTVHVYGTLDPRARADLERAAQRGARLGLTRPATWIQNPVVADRDYRREDFPDAHLALYGDAGDNSVVARMADAFPIRVGDGFVELRGRRLGARHGVRMIHPDPDDPTHYVTVVAADSPRDVYAAMGLPDLLPDYVVWDPTTLRRPSGWVHHPSVGLVEAGFFDEQWRLRPESSLVRTEGREGLEALP